MNSRRIVQVVFTLLIVILGSAPVQLQTPPATSEPATPAGQSTPGARPEGPRMSMEEFMKHFAQGAVTIVDVRPAWTYRAGHIPGAISIPIDTMARQVSKLKTAVKPIVAYCS
jgi:3-mercaptopyruvate sulfurtransferase SseA